MNIAITLDIAKPNDVQRVRLRHGEMNSTVLTFVVNEGGVALDLNNYEAVKFCAQKDDGIIIDKLNPLEDGTVIYSLPAGLASMPGEISLAYLALYNNSDEYVATTQAIVFEVLEAVDEKKLTAVYSSEFEEIKTEYEEFVAQVEAAEAGRVNAEQERVSNEDERVAAEQERISKENARVAAETARESAETARASAEQGRASAEETRAQAESERVIAEAERVEAEAGRAAAEQGRVTAETGRETAEAKRKADFAELMDTAQGLTAYICQEGEYNTETLEPTVSGVANIIYLVPTPEMIDDNSYLEWMWLSGKWEKIGTTGTTVTPISTNTIEEILNGESETGSASLNTTGLSYLIMRLKQLMAGAVHYHSTDDITSGVLPIARGGTGKATANAAQNALLGGMGELTAAPTDESQFVFMADKPSDTNGAVRKRSGSKVWEWIYTKIKGSVSPSDIGAQAEMYEAAGVIYPYAGNTESIPDGYLLCDGSAVSRTTYAALFSVIGTTYGEGDGASTFNLPDLQSRVPVGGSSLYELGATGGESTCTLTTSEIPSHSHETGLTDNKGKKGFAVTKNLSSDSTARYRFSSSGNYITVGANTNASDYESTDDITVVYKTSSVGNGGAHNNMQPYTVVNYIISTGQEAELDVNTIVQDIQTLPLAIEYGGTSATTASQALKNLGVTIGTGDPPDTGTPGTIYIKVAS